MSDAIIVALITGGISLFGTILTVIATSHKQTENLNTSMAVVKNEMQHMKEDIATHNQYAKMFSENIPAIKQHMTDTDRRLDNIERRLA